MTNNTETNAPETITTIDQNTLRPIVWNVEYFAEAGPNVNRTGGWTHCAGVSRPKGRRSYMVWLVIDETGTVVRTSTPVKVF